MNFSILKQEFLNLINAVNDSSFHQKEISNRTLSRTFFDMPISVETDRQSKSLKTESPFGRMSDISIKDINSNNKESFKRSNRQNIILTLLKKKKELTIKDIAEVIKDCSEKTIQRELISFIRAGVLKRLGERRWSKYSLA